MSLTTTDEAAGAYDRLSELKAFDETKAGVKGLVDAGVTAVPAIFHHHQHHHLQQQEQPVSSSSSGGGDDDEETRRSSSLSREDLERLVGPDDDDKFNGLDLANLIRKKYGRSYDVTLIKKVQCSARPSWPLN